MSFTIKFRKLIRTKSKLDTFIEFTFDDLDMKNILFVKMMKVICFKNILF